MSRLTTTAADACGCLRLGRSGERCRLERLASWPGDFKKPLSLDLDRCSRLVFVQYRDDLEPWVAGTRAPDDLERYEEYHDFVPS